MIILAIRYILLTIWMMHPFNVSVCEVYHNSESKRLEITMKIFIDDLELALRNQGHDNFTFPVKAGQDERTNRFLGDYLLQKFKIKINDSKTSLSFLGHELDEDVVMCYIESEVVKEIDKIWIYNDILVDVFDDQINLTHFQYHDQMKSLKAVKGKPAGTIDASLW